MGTYGQLLRALDMDNRADEAHQFWVKKVSADLHSVPWQLCGLMISVYYRNNMLENLVKVCFCSLAINYMHIKKLVLNIVQVVFRSLTGFRFIFFLSSFT